MLRDQVFVSVNPAQASRQNKAQRFSRHLFQDTLVTIGISAFFSLSPLTGNYAISQENSRVVRDQGQNYSKRFPFYRGRFSLQVDLDNLDRAMMYQYLSKMSTLTKYDSYFDKYESDIRMAGDTLLAKVVDEKWRNIIGLVRICYSEENSLDYSRGMRDLEAFLRNLNEYAIACSRMKKSSDAYSWKRYDEQRIKYLDKLFEGSSVEGTSERISAEMAYVEKNTERFLAAHPEAYRSMLPYEKQEQFYKEHAGEIELKTLRYELERARPALCKLDSASYWSLRSERSDALYGTYRKGVESNSVLNFAVNYLSLPFLPENSIWPWGWGFMIPCGIAIGVIIAAAEIGCRSAAFVSSFFYTEKMNYENSVKPSIDWWIEHIKHTQSKLGEAKPGGWQKQMDAMLSELSDLKSKYEARFSEN